MSVRELVILGSSSQVPTRYRNHNGYMLLWDGMGVLFDPGEGTQRQMLHAGVRSHQIHAICVTHFHGDHCLGLPGILQRLSLDAVPHPIQVFYPESGQKYFERLRYSTVYLEQAEIIPRPMPLVGGTGRIGPLTLTSLPLRHRTPAIGYRLEEPSRLKVDGAKARALGVDGPDVGKLLSEGSVNVDGRIVMRDEVATEVPGQSVSFIMDTSPCPSVTELSRKVDMMICESTYQSELTLEAHQRGHMTSEDAGKAAAEAGARRLVLTHFSQRYTTSEGFLNEAQAFHPDVTCAEDLLRIPLKRKRA